MKKLLLIFILFTPVATAGDMTVKQAKMLGQINAFCESTQPKCSIGKNRGSYKCRLSRRARVDQCIKVLLNGHGCNN